jgi:hypothetical protein
MSRSGPSLQPVSPSADLSGLGLEDRQAAVLAWFGSNFEDPVQETPWDSEDRTHVYVWGGPYDARKQLDDAFPDLDDNEREALAAEIERDGTIDWSPHASRVQDDDEEEAVPDFDDLRILLMGLQGDIRELRELVASQIRPIGIGHNAPPDELTVEDLDGAAIAAAAALVQIDLAQPDPLILAKAAEVLKAIAAKIRAFLKSLPLWIATGAVTGAANFATQQILAHPEKVAHKLEQASQLLHLLFKL